MVLLIAIGLAFLTIAVHGAPIHDSKPCELDRFSNCTNTFAQKLGLPEMPPSIYPLLEAIGSIIQKQLYPGASLIRAAFLDMKQCLGDEYSTCISMEFLTSIGESTVDAQSYISLDAELDYMCTLGWITITNNWGCIYGVSLTEMARLEKCTSDFVDNVTKDPDNLCNYVQTFTNCIDDIYRDKCNDDVAKMVCTTEQISLNITVPQCPAIKC